MNTAQPQPMTRYGVVVVTPYTRTIVCWCNSREQAQAEVDRLTCQGERATIATASGSQEFHSP
jgi:hypothetical protein